MSPVINLNQDNITKLKLSSGNSLDINSIQQPNLFELLKTFPDSLKVDVQNNRINIIIGDGENDKNKETYDLVLRDNEKLLTSLEELVKLRLNGEIPPTLGTKNLAVNFTVLPNDDIELYKLVKTANDIKFQLVIEEVKTNSIIVGLRNTSAYTYKPVLSANNSTKIGYEKITNAIEMRLSVPIDRTKLSLIDGTTTKAILDRALELDNKEASIRIEGGNSMSKPNNRKTQFLTRLKTEGMIAGLIENEDVIGLIQKASGTLHSDFVEAQAQVHQGLHYRYAEALNSILSRSNLTDNRMSKDELASVALPTLSNLAKLYNQSPEIIELLAQGANLQTEEGKKLYNNRLIKVAKSLAVDILDQRKELSNKILLDENSRVLAFCQDNNEIDANKFVNCIQSKGIPEDRILAYKNKSKSLTDEQKLIIEKSVSNKEENAFIYLWSHGDHTGSSVVEMNDLVNSIVKGCPKTTFKNGLQGLDLSHISVIFDHCLSGLGAERFLKMLQAKVKQEGLELINIPITVGASQQKEYSKGSDISLFLEVLQALPANERKCFRVSDLLNVTNSMFQHSKNLVSSWQHAIDPQIEYQRRVMITSHTPLIFGRKSNSINQLIQIINKELNNEEDKSQPVLRLPKLNNDNSFWPHLSKNEIFMPKISIS